MIKSKMMYHSRNINTIVELISKAKKTKPQFEKSKLVQNEVIELLEEIILPK